MLIQFDLCYKNFFPDSLLKQSNQENFDKKKNFYLEERC